MADKYRVPVLENYQFQPPVINKSTATPPVSPAKGDRYLVAASATGDWLGKEKNIAWFDGSIWKFDLPLVGMLVYVSAESKFYVYGGSTWGLLFEELGLGDMLKSVYDADNNGIVDKAETVDDGAGNSSTAADVKDAVTKKHAHTNKTVLDAIEVAFTTALKSSYDSAVSLKHTQGTDQGLDTGGANEVSASQVKGAVTNSHTHSNKTILDAIDVAFTTVLKGQYDTAYSRRAQYDVDLGCLTFEL
jgi:hypothetical protein